MEYSQLYIDWSKLLHGEIVTVIKLKSKVQMSENSFKPQASITHLG